MNDSLTQYVARAVAKSPRVQAAAAEFEERRLAVLSRRSLANPQLELAPGVGATNGNFILSQELDVFGSRRAEASVVMAEADRAEANLRRVRTQAAAQILSALIEIHAAEHAVASATTLAEASTQLAELVRKRVEIGEAPAVHFTRAELEARRAAQAVQKAKLLRDTHRAELASMTRQQPTDQLPDLTWSELVIKAKSAPASSPTVAIAESDIRIASAEVRAVSAAGRPRLFAGIASDIWSLDRNAVRGSNFGIQLTLSAPLGDLGETRYAVESAKSQVRAAEAVLAEQQRLTALAHAQAVATLITAESVFAAYETEMVVKAEGMVQAMRQGYANGLVTLVEVLEAQRAAIEIQQERTSALAELRRAELQLLIATQTLPGWEVVR